MNKLFYVEDNEETCRTEVSFLFTKFKYLNKKLIKQPDYTNALNKIKNKKASGEKVKVGFLVSEIAKWNADELYSLLEKSKEFKPYILATLSVDVHNGKDTTKNNYEEICDYFNSRGMNVVNAYDTENKKYIDMNTLDMDIIFYQQPWYLSELQDVYNASKTALCCYFPYGLNIFDSPIDNKPFHEKLYYYFVPNTLAKEQIWKYKYTQKDNIVPVGFPKIDVYKNMKIEKDTKTIIYAPHFGYEKKQAIRVGTFPWSGERMLEFAKRHSEYNWIFKPHPNLKYTLVKDKHFGKEYAENYYSEWAKIAEINQDSNYFKIFCKSDLLKTDSCSFLLEYMPTGKPIIRLDRKDSTPLSLLGVKLLEGIYRVFDFNEFEEIFYKLAVQKDDVLAQKRKEITDNIIFEHENPNEEIYKIIKSTVSC